MCVMYWIPCPAAHAQWELRASHVCVPDGWWVIQPLDKIKADKSNRSIASFLSTTMLEDVGTKP